MALEAFGTASGLIEKASAIAGRAQVLARLGYVAEAKDLFTSLAELDSGYEQNEVYAEAADAMDSFGSRETALGFLDRVGHQSTVSPADKRLFLLSKRESTSDGASSMPPWQLSASTPRDLPPFSAINRLAKSRMPISRWLGANSTPPRRCRIAFARGDARRARHAPRGGTPSWHRRWTR